MINNGINSIIGIYLQDIPIIKVYLSDNLIWKLGNGGEEINPTASSDIWIDSEIWNDNNIWTE
jgi:hypothetical protein